MKKFFKPARIGFYLLMPLTFFMAGLYFAGYIEAGKNQGLAGGAIVLSYGVMFGGVALIASFFIAHFLELSKIKIINWIMLVVVLATWGYTHYKFKQKKAAKEDEIETIQNKKPTETTAPAIANLTLKIDETSTNEEIGLGFFTPNFYEHPTLFFYGGVNHEKGIIEHTPKDSLAFKQTETGWTTTYGPPYLYPEAMKLDYGMVFFKVLAVGREFLKVEVNRETGQTGYVDKSKGTYKSWPEMLLSINTVERLDGHPQLARIKALDHAGEVNVAFDFLRPLLVEGDWVYGILTDTNFKEVGKGWVRWKKDGKLLISYSNFS